MKTGIFLILITVLTGCALYNSSQPVASLVTTCSIPTDQSGTVEGRWPQKPIPVAFAQGQFNATEIAAIVGALDTWNRFFTLSKKFNIFDYGTDPLNPKTDTAVNVSSTGNLCAQKIIPTSGGAFTGNVVIYKVGTWPANYSPTYIALTSYCVVTATPYPSMYMSIMEVNYQNFFVAGTQQPDLQSVMLHELGHLAGLDHSCAASQRTGFPECSDSAIPADYLTAAMYPAFSFDAVSGLGQQKRLLQTNDQSRANCLY